MTLIRDSKEHWIMLDDSIHTEGTSEYVLSTLTLRIAKLFSFFYEVDLASALIDARNEVEFALSCMYSEGHNMAEFGTVGHFIRTLPQDVQMAS